MAVDEHLLAKHCLSGTPLLRLYGWTPPAITIGRYQGTERIDLDACRERGVEVVRRITGGGAIFHDNEVTYSVVWPDTRRGSQIGTERLFETINAFILETYRSLGLDPVYAKERGPREKSSGRAQFCFSGNENHDILIAGKKIGGNAQRQVRGAVLQHGSIPLAIDYSALQIYFRDRIDAGNFTALSAACGREVSAHELGDRITDAFRNVMGVGLAEMDIDGDEEASVRELMDDRYSRDEWNYLAGTEGR